MFAYWLKAMIDTASGVVLDLEAAPARKADEPEAAPRMIERTKQRLGRMPEILTADAACGLGNLLTWAEGPRHRVAYATASSRRKPPSRRQPRTSSTASIAA